MSELPNTKNDCFVSVVMVTQNDGDTISQSITDVQAHLEASFTDYEIMIIDQRSTDATEERIEDLLTHIPSIRYIRLAMPVSNDIAIGAGLENAIGDFVVLFDPIQDPIECITDVVNICRAGSDVVIGVAEQRRSLAYRSVRPLIQWMLHGIGYDLPRNATDLRCLSRRAVNAVTQTGRFHHQCSVRISKTGYPSSSYQYVLKDAGSNYRTLREGLLEAGRLLIFNSTRPLRWMSMLGLVGSMLAFLIASYTILVRLFKDEVAEGWTTMILFMSALFFLMFLMLAFFGEYLGRLLDDRSEQADYSAVFEKNSSVMLDETRRNVLKESTSGEENRVQTGRDR